MTFLLPTTSDASPAILRMINTVRTNPENKRQLLIKDGYVLGGVGISYSVGDPDAVNASLCAATEADTEKLTELNALLYAEFSDAGHSIPSPKTCGADALGKIDWQKALAFFVQYILPLILKDES